MTSLDWSIIAVYLVALVAASALLGRDQDSAEDYYVGGRSLPWWAIGISTMATQTSVVSFMSIPAFVALVEGGGLTWLQYELAVPLAMIAVMVLLLPFFRRLELVSVYEYLEMRFSRGVRKFISAVFLVGRGFGTGVGVYTTAILLRACTGLEISSIILLVGVVTVIYDTLGGMKAVVWSDVAQMILLLMGVVLCIVLATNEAGGVGAVLDTFPRERLRALDFSAGLSGETTSFWAFLFGGLFLYMSYYGTDQSQTQRELSAPTTAGTKKSLVFNGLCRFPLTLLYLALGVALGALYLRSPELRAAVATGSPDDLVPTFVVQYLPAGIRALIIAAMLAAAMSSLDSAINSLSAATMRDFIDPEGRMTGRSVLRMSRLTTVVWGGLVTGCAFLVGGIEGTVIESINKIGSTVYGPILAAFVIGVLSQRANAMGVITGVLAGIAANLCLWIFAPGVSFFWWNLSGFAITGLVCAVTSRMGLPPDKERLDKYTLVGAGLLAQERRWIPTYLSLVAATGVILATGAVLTFLS